MSRFSSTDSSRSVVIACGMTPIERRTSAARFVTSKPLMTTVPLVGGSSVVIIRISVDLPAPLGPSRPKISPASTANDTPLTAVKLPNFLTMLRTSMADMDGAVLLEVQRGVRRHADGQPAVAVVDAQPDLERPDVALHVADVALRREAGVGRAVEHGARALVARRQADRERVADPHAVDVGLLHVDADPQLVLVDQRHDRLARAHVL